MFKIGIRIALIKMIIKNIFSKDKKHYPTRMFIDNGNIKKDWILIKVLNKQTDSRFIKEWDKPTLQERVNRAIEKIDLKIKQYEKRIKLREENPCFFDEEKSIKRFYERVEGLELAKKYLEEELE